LHFLNWSAPAFESYYPKRFADEVAEILKLKNGQPKQEAKKKLLNNVLDWIKEDSVNAVREFEVSAAEVIGVLKKIAEHLASTANEALTRKASALKLSSPQNTGAR
jgi:hypothetical protein